jgi:hypothetical protein
MKPLPLLVLLAACGPEVPATDFGVVYLASEPGLGFSDAGAVFRRGQRFAYDCVEETVAGCRVLTCGDELPAAAPVDVGPITLTGAAQPIEMAFDQGYEGVFLMDEALFAGGEAIAVSAPGADGPALALSVTAPTALTVTAPAWPAGNDRLRVPQAEALAFAWSGASAGELVVNLSDEAQVTSVQCAFPAADGVGEVPAAALAALPLGGGYVDVELRSEQITRDETWELRLAVSTHAEVAPGSLAIAQVVVE